ncbi:MAG: phosphopyruvate hydratase [Bdellovibrionota bacterium]
MSEILDIRAREILDSRGNPTVEVEITGSSGFSAYAAVPSGASTGAHEAAELRDDDKKRYHGKGVLRAIQNVEETIADKLIGFDCLKQRDIDQILINLDGTENKSNLGANALLGVSLACTKLSALELGIPVYEYVGGVLANTLPVPLMNVLNGGAHANNGLDVQEFMIAPVCGGKFSESLRCGSEIFHSLKKILNEKGYSTAVGDEGGFAPKLKNNREALELITTAIEKTGYRLGQDVFLALDVAATELYDGGQYKWEGKKITPDQLIQTYIEWSKTFPMVSIEDGLAEDDWASWASVTQKLGDKMQLVGDDLFVTNPKRIHKGLEQGVANSVLIKVNQIGTLSETADAIAMAHRGGYTTVMSHRSGETEDSIIADLAVGFGCAQIKTGSLCRGERTAKYNQLLRIEHELGGQARFFGLDAFKQ